MNASARTLALLGALVVGASCERAPSQVAPVAPTSSVSMEPASSAAPIAAGSSQPANPWPARIANGTPEEKEEAIEHFRKTHDPALVPAVIDAILDDTRAPRHGDTGWATVHHHAATAMGELAHRVDGKSQKERGYDAYSFYDDGGVGTSERRLLVHTNWIEWWRKNEPAVRALEPKREAW